MSESALLSVAGLSVYAGAKPLLRDVTFSLHPGQVLTLVGESGAGKSLLAQAVMGNLPKSLQASGSVCVQGKRSEASDAQARRSGWGHTLALLPQEPAQALNPLMRTAAQLTEVHRFVRGATPQAAQAQALDELAASGLQDASQHYPWQLSGGMAQRAVAAMACAGGAQIVLADEPTKGLDPHWRNHLLTKLQAVQQQGGCVVVITHDLRVARALGGHIAVLQAGEIVEQGEAHGLLAAPQHPFTRQLIAADPSHWQLPAAPAPGAAVLSARGLSKGFGGTALFDALDIDLHAGQRLVVQGPSGAGKSTLGNVLLGLLPADGGTVTRAPGLAATAFQKLYQDPVASFVPQISLAQSLRDAARLHGCAWPDVLRRLDKLGVPHALLERRPTQVSGGELQRVALARVLIARPALLFADEPTSRLDAISQREAMAVLLDAVDACGAALVLVTHDDDIAHAVGTQRLDF